MFNCLTLLNNPCRYVEYVQCKSDLDSLSATHSSLQKEYNTLKQLQQTEQAAKSFHDQDEPAAVTAALNDGPSSSSSLSGVRSSSVNPTETIASTRIFNEGSENSETISKNKTELLELQRELAEYKARERERDLYTKELEDKYEKREKDFKILADQHDILVSQYHQLSFAREELQNKHMKSTRENQKNLVKLKQTTRKYEKVVKQRDLLQAAIGEALHVQKKEPPSS